MEYQDAKLIILISLAVTAFILGCLAIKSIFPSKKEPPDEIEANAMACPPALSSDNTLANNHTYCCCKRPKQPDLPIKRPKHPSDH